MTLLSALRVLLLVAVLLCSATRTQAQEEEASPTLYEWISSNPETFLTFRTAVDLAGLAESLQDSAANYTVIAPTNDAFGTINGKYLDAEWQPYLKAFLEYHILEGSHESSSFKQNTSFVSLFDRQMVAVTEADPITLDTQAMLINGNLLASNGILHVINSVLTPNFMELSLVDQLQQQQYDSKFYQLMSQVNVAALLTNSQGPYTVLVPTDEAMLGLGLEELHHDTLREIVLYHIVPSIAFTYDLSMDEALTVTTLQGESIDLTATSILEDKSNILASNGVLHSLDTVLIPSTVDISLTTTTTTPTTAPSASTIEEDDVATVVPTIIGTTTTEEDELTIMTTTAPSESDSITTTEELPSLIQLLLSPLGFDDSPYAQFLTSLILTDLDITLLELEDDQSLTIFAPSNSAFDIMPAKLLEEDWKMHLTALLTYHVVPGTIMTNDLSGNDELTTVNGEILRITSLDPVEVNSQVVVTSPNLLASNGIVHDIPSLLLPSFVSNTIFSTLETHPDTSVLTSILSNNLGPLATTPGGSLTTELESSNTAYTVLAPINSALLRYQISTPSWSEEDQLEVIQYHVLPGLVPAENFTMATGASFVTVQGQEIADGIITEANIVQANVLCNNGIIHYIDTVLLPPEDITDAPTESPTTPITAADVVGDVEADAVLSTILPTMTSSMDVTNTMDPTFDMMTDVPEELDATMTMETDAPVTMDASTTTPTTETSSLLELISSNPNLTKLSKLLSDSGVDTTLEMTGSPFTVFAPTDSGFTAIDFLVQDWSTEDLVQILSYHVVSGVYLSTDLSDGMHLTSLLGNNLTITLDPAKVNGEAWIDSVDNRADNGVLHTISTVLLPVLSEDETIAPTLTSPTTTSNNMTTACEELGTFPAYASVCCPLQSQAFAAFCENWLSQYNMTV